VKELTDNSDEWFIISVLDWYCFKEVNQTEQNQPEKGLNFLFIQGQIKYS
jgi:hypothetical protein